MYKQFKSVFYWLTDRLDTFKQRLRLRFTSKRHVLIVPYRGFGNLQTLFLTGRVLTSRLLNPMHTDGRWQNLKNTYKRFGSNEIKDASIQIEIAGQTQTCNTNHEGYYALNMPNLTQVLKPREVWFQVKISLVSAPVAFKPPYSVRGEVMLPNSTAKYGIISDIDDTILHTAVLSMTRMLYLTLFKNAHSREQVPGAAAFIQALRVGRDQAEQHPVFYVSNGPWNLYDMLTEFMQVNNFVKGPLSLRDFGRHKDAVTYRLHKRDSVARIIKTYPNLQFILMGDSAEKDLDIYTEIATNYPGRVAAIFIRMVRSTKRKVAVLKKAALEEKVPIILFTDYDQAVKHALEMGLIANSKT
jgi:phosphatidate phosphatase APP1